MIFDVIAATFLGYLIIILLMCISFIYWEDTALEGWFMRHHKKILAPIIIVGLVVIIAGIRHKLVTSNGENACQQCCEEVVHGK